MHWKFTVKKYNIKKHILITSLHDFISIIIPKITSKRCLMMILKLNLSIMKHYKKLCCDSKSYNLLYVGKLRLEDNFNFISILHPYLDQYVNSKQTDFKEMMLLNQHHFIRVCIFHQFCT